MMGEETFRGRSRKPLSTDKSLDWDKQQESAPKKPVQTAEEGRGADKAEHKLFSIRAKEEDVDEFKRLCEKDPETLVKLTHADLFTLMLRAYKEKKG